MKNGEKWAVIIGVGQNNKIDKTRNFCYNIYRKNKKGVT